MSRWDERRWRWLWQEWVIPDKKNVGAGVCVMNKMECSNVPESSFFFFTNQALVQRWDEN